MKLFGQSLLTLGRSRRRSQNARRAHKPNAQCRWTQLHAEGLEDRRMMAANIFLDFGEGFQFDSTQLEYVFDIEESKLGDVNAPRASVLPGEVFSVLDSLLVRGIDYNDDGAINEIDVTDLGVDVADIVQRVYEPFDVNVQIAAAADMDDVKDTLSGGSSDDAYVLVAGQALRMSDGRPNGMGWARRDTGSPQDNMAFGFADDLITAVANDPERIAYSLARTSVHEAAHTFGLRHLRDDVIGEDEEPAIAASAELELLMNGDLMNTVRDPSSGSRFEHLQIASRWTFPVDDSSDTQNSYEELESRLGLRPGAPAYVTGSGANDRITITLIGDHSAGIIVDARDNSGDSIATRAYAVDARNGILVEGGLGDDRIEVININGKTAPQVTLRGGSGDDVLIGGAASDHLQGDRGDDALFGGAGNDSYHFAGPLPRSLGTDSISDSGGVLDSLDFSQLKWGVNVDMTNTATQDVDRDASRARLNLVLAADAITGLEGIFGTEYDDVMRGNPSHNVMFGYGGNDEIRGRGGNDGVFGGEGADTIRGDGGNDGLYGEGGRDYIVGHDGADQLYGGSENDSLFGGDHNDVLYAGAGDDKVRGEAGDDRLYGEAGHDWMHAHSGNDFLSGGLGNDRMYGGDHHDRLYGGAGNDKVRGEGGNDRLYGEAGHDWMRGHSGDDFLNGGSGNDRMYGGSGHDRMYGLSGNDRMYGESGNDQVYGGWGRDALYGGSGRDLLKGGYDGDWLYGGSGNDSLYGEAGYDYLYGEEDNDWLDGGGSGDYVSGGSGYDGALKGAYDQYSSVEWFYNVIQDIKGGKLL